MKFAELTAPAIRRLSRSRTLILAPIAACEQHSRHLPVFTDSILCHAVAERVEQSNVAHILMLPTLWLGASEHHLPFGGTLTATLPTYETTLVELLSPLLRDGFLRVLILNGHGGNNDPLRVALRRLDVMFPKAILTGAAYWDLASKEIEELCQGPLKRMGHACEIETSMMMHLRPDLVHHDEIADDPTTSEDAFHGLTWARDFERATDHGAMGHPESATAETGAKLLDAIATKVSEVADRIMQLPLH